MTLRAIVVIAVVLLATSAAAEMLLHSFSVDEVQARCARTHGTFFNHGAFYGCNFSRGVVQCDGRHCVGYPRPSQRRRVIVRPPAPEQPAPPEYYGDRW